MRGQRGVVGPASNPEQGTMNDKPVLDIEGVKASLLAHRDELLQEAADTAGERETVELDQARVGRLSRMDAMQAQAMSVELQRRRELELRRIASALKRITEGDYGYCITCGEPIDPKRLEIEPTSSQCIRCASQSERDR